MRLGNSIDVIIAVFLIFSLIMGFRNGLIKSIFISFGFIIKVALTYVIYTAFGDALLTNDSVVLIISRIREPMVKNLPNIAMVTDIVNRLIFIILIFVVASIFVALLFHMLKDLMSQDVLSIGDKMLGAIFSFAKSVLIIMLIIYAVDKVGDTVLSKSTKDLLTESILLPRLYYYNVFMNIFGQ